MSIPIYNEIKYTVLSRFADSGKYLNLYQSIHYRWSTSVIIVMYDTLCPEMCREHRCFQHSWLVCGERSVILLSPVDCSWLHFSWQARTWSSGRNTVGSVWIVTVLWQVNDHSLPHWCHATAPCRIVLLKWPAWSASVSHLLNLAKGSDCWYGAPDPFIFTKNPRSHTNKKFNARITFLCLRYGWLHSLR